MLRISTTFSFFLRSHGYCSTNFRPLLGSVALSGTAVTLVAPHGAPALVACACADGAHVNARPSVVAARRPSVRFMISLPGRLLLCRQLGPGEVQRSIGLQARRPRQLIC